jgi:CBS domain-containing protein
MDGDVLDAEYATQPDRKVADVMNREVISAEPESSVSDMATLMVRHKIKRVPIVQNGKLVGIVSRVNLIRALAGFDEKAVQLQTGR